MAQTKGGITHEDIIRSVRAGDVKPVYLLMGAEDYYIDKLSDFLTDTLLKPEERDFNLDVVYGLEVTADKVVELARAYPMMADRRVVLVREAQAMRSLDALEAYMQHYTPTTVLIICYKHGVLDKRKAVTKQIDQIGVIYESKRLYDSQLPQFITQYFSRKGRFQEHADSKVLSRTTTKICLAADTFQFIYIFFCCVAYILCSR